MSRYSMYVIEALVQVVSGGSGGTYETAEEPIGIYRTKSDIDGLLMQCGIDPARGEGSRLPALRGALCWAQRQDDGDAMIGRVVEAATDPRSLKDRHHRLGTVLDHMNRALRPDGFEVVVVDGASRLRPAGAEASVVAAVAETTGRLDFDTVRRDLDRALHNTEDDPEDAVTAACSTLEGVMRTILVELGEPLPAKKDVGGLMRAVQKPLGLSPGRGDVPNIVADDVRAILGGLATATGGIGALRTHGGDAHGRERGARRIDPRIARLAIHAASTVALFLIETWEKVSAGGGGTGR